MVGPLTELEQRLVDALRADGTVDLSVGDPAVDAPAGGASWGPERTVAAHRLAEILVEASQEGRRPPSLGLFGARVTGSLDLADVELAGGVGFADCYFDEPVRLSGASMPWLALSGSHVPQLVAGHLTVARAVRLDAGFTCPGGVTLAVAKIGGQLICDGADLGGQVPVALFAERMEVANGAFFDEGFRARGEIRMLSARIGSSLSISDATIDNPGGTALALDRMFVDGRLGLQRVTLDGAIKLGGARVAAQVTVLGGSAKGEVAINADGIRVEGDMFLRDGFEAEGSISLVDARIDAELGFSDVRLRSGSDRPAIHAVRARVGANLSVYGGCVIEGGFDVSDAQVGGRLVLQDAHVAAANRPALHGDGLKVASDFVWAPGLRVTGVSRLIDMTVGGQLLGRGARFSNPGDVVIFADTAEVRGGIFFDSGFVAEGEVRLVNATVTNQLSALATAIVNGAGRALNADGIRVTAGTLLGEGTLVEGEANFNAADLDGGIGVTGRLASGTGTALRLTGARVRGASFIGPLSLEGVLDLTNASFATYIDTESRWPAELKLDGLSYDAIESEPAVDVDARLRWLRRSTTGYAPQPYDQLAASYRRHGRDDDARRVAIAKNRHRRSALPLPAKAWNVIMHVTVGYGYRMWQALVWLAALLALGTLVFDQTHPEQFEPAKDPPPEFHGFTFALDSLVPVINLHQRDAWYAHDYAFVWSIILTILGWTLTTAVVAALSGLVRRD